jgi:hypothetical protein
MKKSIIIIALFFTTAITFAQNSNDYLELSRDVIKTEKKAAIAEVMQLTDTESVPFWKLYDEYDAKMRNLNTKYINLIKDYANNYSNMTDAKANELYLKSMKIDLASTKLEKKYYKKFLKVLPAIKTVRLFQAENKIEALVKAKLALEIPLFE